MTTTTPKPGSAERASRARTIVRTVFYAPMILFAVGAYLLVLTTW